VEIIFQRKIFQFIFHPEKRRRPSQGQGRPCIQVDKILAAQGQKVIWIVRSDRDSAAPSTLSPPSPARRSLPDQANTGIVTNCLADSEGYWRQEKKIAAQMLSVAPLTVLGDFTVSLENLVPDGTGYMKTKLFINVAILWKRTQPRDIQLARYI
jgi:hypothetical protein